MPKNEEYKNWSMKQQDDPDRIDSLSASEVAADHVPSAFEHINPSGDFLGCVAKDKVPSWDYQHYFKEAITEKLSNHFQGFQRLRAPGFAVLSGGNSKKETAHLLVAEMASRTGSLVWRSNRIKQDEPPGKDKVVRTIQVNDAAHVGAHLHISRNHWHAGGICCLGDLLAVPLEGKKDRDGSVIVFYDMQKPKNPGLLPFSINRPGRKAGSIAMTKLDDSRYVLAVHATLPNRGRALEFHFSKSDRLHEGFLDSSVTWLVEDIRSEGDEDANFSDYQNIEFVKDSNGELYLIGMHNNWKLVPNPFFDGLDFIDLFRVEFSEGDVTDDPARWCRPRITKIAHRHMKSDRGQSNLDAGSGVFVTDTGELVLYACSHFMTPDRQINFSEFRCDSSVYSLPHIRDFDRGWVDLYDDTRFRDRFLSLDTGVNPKLDDFNEVYVRGSRFNDKVSSLRMQLPEGYALQLFPDRGGIGDPLTIPGSGYVISVANLKGEKFNDKASSLKIVPVS